jgi:large subunit ribosomal protein L4e
MAKLNILDMNGAKKKEITTDIFDAPIRKDIIQKIVEVEKYEERQKQRYGPYWYAGMETSASGSVKHNRHVWKTDRGKGMSRFPKKRMSDKGDRFVWVGAVSPDTRKGRRAHPPHIIRADIKINKKELLFGLKSALSLVSSSEEITKKYSSLAGKQIKAKLPVVVEEKILSAKTKDVFNALKKIFGEEVFSLLIQNKEQRAGIGKMRGRRYKYNAGLLLIVGDKEERKISGFDVVKAKNIKLKDLASNGARFTAFTENAIKDLENKISGKSTKEENKK